VIAERFEYRAAGDAVEAAALLAENPEGSRILGGGTWLIPEMSRGESTPTRVVDLGRAGMNAVAETDDGLVVGAMASYTDLLDSPLVQRLAPLLHLAAGSITGGWSIRNQGTIGGSLAAARPQSDMPATLVAVGARAVIHGRHGARRLSVANMIEGPMRTTVGRDEVLSAFEIPRTGAGVGYYKLKRGASSWPIVTAAALVKLQHGACTSARLVLGAVAATPIVVDVSQALVGSPVDRSSLQAAQRAAALAVVEPWEDVLASGEYRAAVAGPVARRALEMAFETEARGA
jgi:aerobic carbon-monoxide dehydrogenase medium subunit